MLLCGWHAAVAACAMAQGERQAGRRAGEAGRGGAHNPAARRAMQNNRIALVGGVVAIVLVIAYLQSRSPQMVAVEAPAPQRHDYGGGELVLPSGIIHAGIARYIEEEGTFREMESYSDGWLARHGETLRDMGFQWEIDNYRWWSRRYEYPYIWERILAHLKVACEKNKGGKPLQILDVGSGISFFHYFVKTHAPCPVHVVASDYDKSYTRIFAAINKGEDNHNVEHRVEDMRERSAYADESFDAVYCVSVLEHVPVAAHQSAVDQISRVLKPGGAFVVSFDVSTSNNRAISIPKAQNLLAMFRVALHETNAQLPDEHSTVLQPHHLTPKNTLWARPRDLPKSNLDFTTACHSFVKAVNPLA